MPIHRIPALVALLLTIAGSPALAAEPIPGIGPVGEIKKVKTGFDFTEGPADDGQGNLYFTDIPNTAIHILKANGELEVFTKKSGHSNGLMFNAQGQLVACEMDGQLVAWDVKEKKRHVLVSQYEGKRFNAPNDMVIDRTGGIYFTDPHFRAPDPWPQGKRYVYYWSKKSGVRRVTGALPAPNGIMLSPDEKTLYVFPSMSDQMVSYVVKSPGEIGEKQNFCKLQPGGKGCDGTTVDTKGNLYLTTHLGVEVFTPQGKALGYIEFPEKPANVTFGGKDRKTLYVTARTSLYSAKMEATGHRFAVEKPAEDSE